jgi:hypothetical protein
MMTPTMMITFKPFSQYEDGKDLQKMLHLMEKTYFTQLCTHAY